MKLHNSNALDAETCFEELGEILSVWEKHEALTFSEANNPPPSAQRLFSPRARAKASHSLRVLLAHHSALQEFGAALTLLDALASKIESSRHPSPHLTIEELMELASLAAIVRLVLKCSAVSLSQGPPVSVVEEHLGLGEALQTDLVATRELRIVATMAGRVVAPSLPAPGQWLSSVLGRLEVLAALQPEQAGEFELAMQSATAATDLLSRYVGISPSFPPRVLALGGCVLGLVAVGAVAAEEARPDTVSLSLWESLLTFWQGILAKQDSLKPTLVLDLELVSAAACCSSKELQVWAFRSVQGLHDAVVSN
jgi:hypothetical protein